MDYLQYFKEHHTSSLVLLCFKPYYKWITFNTEASNMFDIVDIQVLNLIINGLPSILI